LLPHELKTEKEVIKGEVQGGSFMMVLLGKTEKSCFSTMKYY